MNKKGKAKELGIIGYLSFCIVFIVAGAMMLDNNTATSPEAISMINNIGGIFLGLGIFGIIVAIILGIAWLSKNI